MTDVAGPRVIDDAFAELEPRHDALGWVAACGIPDPADVRSGCGAPSRAMATDRNGCVLRLLGSPGTALTARDDLGTCGLVLDGVIYERDELRAQLSDGSAPIADDAALMLRAYLRWGEGMLQKVRGVFALVVWDGRKNLLLGARDRMGLYPLFYARAGREVLLSTSPEALVRHPRVSAELNRAVLAESLCYRMGSAEETTYTAVRRVPQGHVVRLTAPGRSLQHESHRYWNPAPTSADVDWIRDNHVERFDEALDRAVGRALAMGPAGIFLSGGLDSVSVAAVAATRARAEDLPAPWGLSLVFPDSLNEEAVQRSVAAKLRLPQLLVPFEGTAGAAGMMMAALELSRRYPAPLLNLWQPAYLGLGAEGRRRGCRTILTGWGGDTWLTATPYVAGQLIRTGNVRGLYRLYWDFKRSYPVGHRAMTRRILWQAGARPVLAGVGAAVLRRTAPGILRARRRRYIDDTTPGFVAPDGALRRELDRRADESLPEPRLEDFAWRERQIALDAPSISTRAEEEFESARRNGLRLFATYQDADLVDTLMRMPPEVLNKGGRTRALVRETLSRRFPQLGFDRQKKVLVTSYFASMVRREARRAWDAMGGTPTLARLGVAGAGAVKLEVDRILANERVRAEFRIWSLLSLEAWARARVQP